MNDLASLVTAVSGPAPEFARAAELVRSNAHWTIGRLVDTQTGKLKSLK